MSLDFIIVGQGIAGSMLAWFLLKEGKKILLIDDGSPNSASRVATGVINPVTGKRLVKSWMIDELLPFSKKTYGELENVLQLKFLEEKKIARIFSNKEDLQFFRQKNELDEMPAYVKRLKEIPECFHASEFGGVEISGALQISMHDFLKEFREWFRRKQILREEKFSIERLQVLANHVVYDSVNAEKIIFCEGSFAACEGFFKHLPFNLAKGEFLTAEMKDMPEDKLWHKGIFISAAGNSVFRIGPTYEWNFKDHFPSEAAKNILEQKLKKAVKLSYKITDHLAGVRPTVLDRRPLIGVHPDFSAVGIFNGLGTKGVSLAPFFAHEFSQYLIFNKKLNSEVDIKRFAAR